MPVNERVNGWTGGQYSLFRFIFGVYLFLHFVSMLPNWGAEMFSNNGVLPGSASITLHLFPNMFALCDAPWFVTSIIVLASGLSVLLSIGKYDRFAAVGLWYIWACMFGRDPLILNPGLPYVGLLLIVHALLPRAPYGSLEAKGRIDPGNNWRLPQEYFALVWILMAVGYTYSGYTKLLSPSWVDGTAFYYVLTNPLARVGLVRDFVLSLPPSFIHIFTWGALALELSFLFATMFRRLRPIWWFIMLCMHIGLITLINFADLSMGMVMLHLFTFNPIWIKGTSASKEEQIFYDGSCALCNGAVRFILAEDTRGVFRLAALSSQSYIDTLSETVRAQMPDSMVVVTEDGATLIKSRAWIHILGRLGGVWRVLCLLCRLVPRALADRVYDFIARVRYRVFGRKNQDACALMPKELRKRFDY